MELELKKGVIFIVIVLVIINGCMNKKTEKTEIKQEKLEENVIKKEAIYTNEEYIGQQEIDAYLEEQRRIEEEQQRLLEEQQKTYETRMTSYYSGDELNSTAITGSGLSTDDFEINEYGWYTYNGKLVVATATNYLLNYGFTLADGVRTYSYYEELTLTIDGVDYEAIVIDSCGSSMKTGRIDLFVSGYDSVKDTMIKVKEN